MLRYRLRELNRTWFPRPETMSAALHALLIQRGIASAEEAQRFLNPSADQLHDPMLLSGMPEAAARIRRAIEAGEPICVYGDYDVDGVSASSLLSDYLRTQGAQIIVEYGFAVAAQLSTCAVHPHSAAHLVGRKILVKHADIKAAAVLAGADCIQNPPSKRRNHVLTADRIAVN